MQKTPGVFPVECPECAAPVGIPCAASLTHIERLNLAWETVRARVDEKLSQAGLTSVE